ncbi:MAG: M1 family metallopeptidase [Planctomycetes bacterium]|nr:M1 family metallopeptidase [Planctomycetota bacterium]
MSRPSRIARIPSGRLSACVLVATLGGCTALFAEPGASGLGDPFFPALGNGGYDAVAYDLALTIDPTAKTLDGVATIDARALMALSSFSLELHRLDVREVSVDGRPADFVRDGDELRVTPDDALAEGAHFVVRVTYGGAPEAVPSAAVPFLPGVGWMTSDDSVYVMAEPNGASSWFPCNDHPSDKAFYRFELTVPVADTAVANGVPTARVDHGDGTQTLTFVASDPMATYLATIAVGPFELVEDEGPGGLVLRHWFHPTIEAAQRAPFERVPEMISLFSELFGGYPFECFGSIVSNLQVGAALETQTVPTYGLHSASPSTIAHELAHQWFGDSVSVRSFSDVWLAEGFASYASWLWSEHADGPEAIARRAERTYGMLRRADPGPPAAPGVEDMFGMSVYVRGAFALHALRLTAGDETFFEILRTFTGRYRHGNASVADFEAVVAELAGAEASDTLAEWLHAEHVPEFDLGGDDAVVPADTSTQG